MIRGGNNAYGILFLLFFFNDNSSFNLEVAWKNSITIHTSYSCLTTLKTQRRIMSNPCYLCTISVPIILSTYNYELYKTSTRCFSFSMGCIRPSPFLFLLLPIPSPPPSHPFSSSPPPPALMPYVWWGFS